MNKNPSKAERLSAENRISEPEINPALFLSNRCECPVKHEVLQLFTQFIKSHFPGTHQILLGALRRSHPE